MVWINSFNVNRVLCVRIGACFAVLSLIVNVMSLLQHLMFPIWNVAKIRIISLVRNLYKDKGSLLQSWYVPSRMASILFGCNNVIINNSGRFQTARTCYIINSGCNRDGDFPVISWSLIANITNMTVSDWGGVSKLLIIVKINVSHFTICIDLRFSNTFTLILTLSI